MIFLSNLTSFFAFAPLSLVVPRLKNRDVAHHVSTMRLRGKVPFMGFRGIINRTK
jgi:hypothetical protein